MKLSAWEWVGGFFFKVVANRRCSNTWMLVGTYPLSGVSFLCFIHQKVLKTKYGVTH